MFIIYLCSGLEKITKLFVRHGTLFFGEKRGTFGREKDKNREKMECGRQLGLVHNCCEKVAVASKLLFPF